MGEVPAHAAFLEETRKRRADGLGVRDDFRTWFVQNAARGWLVLNRLVWLNLNLRVG